MKDNEISKHKFRDWLPKILSVIAAIILWYYVIDVRTTTEEITVYAVPIAINNFSSMDGLDIISGKDSTVDVVVRGTKSEIYNVTIDDIYASVDMNGVDTAGIHKMDVDVISLKKGVSVVNKTVSQINVNVDKKISDVVPVKYALVESSIENDYEMGTPELSFDTVRVSGPQNLIETVAIALIEIDLGSGPVKNSITYRGKLKLYDEAGNLIDSPYIKLSDEIAVVEIPVTKSEVKTVVPNFYHGDYSYDYVVYPSEIVIKGSVLKVENIKKIYTSPITETTPGRVNKTLELPEGVLAYDLDGNVVDSVSVTINRAENMFDVNKNTIERETEDNSDSKSSKV